MASNPEARLTLKIRKALEAEGAYVVKVHGGRYSHGVPDLMGCFNGFFFAFEVKMPGRERTVTKLQQANLDRVREALGLAKVITSVDQALWYLTALKKLQRFRKPNREGCWVWAGTQRPNGYGLTRIEGKSHTVHRLSAHLFLDFDLDSELFVCHHCDRRNCYNPEHLFIGTHKDNMADRVSKRNKEQTRYN